jgi:flagellar hook-associated protein 1 FlgK
MATLIPIQVMQRENGGVGILTSGVGLVDGAHHGTLEVRLSGGALELGLQGHPNRLEDLGSRIGGMIRVLNQDIPSVRASLDELAQALVTEINALHQTGTNPAGDTGVDFFDPAGVTASTIGLSAAVAADPGAISAGTGGASGEYRAGANDIALALAGLRDAPNGSLGISFGEHFRRLATDVGFSVRSSLDSVQVHQALSEQAEIRRQSFSGVSTDEELVKLIEFQTAYSAAARVVSVADELLETLVRM